MGGRLHLNRRQVGPGAVLPPEELPHRLLALLDLLGLPAATAERGAGVMRMAASEIAWGELRERLTGREGPSGGADALERSGLFPSVEPSRAATDLSPVDARARSRLRQALDQWLTRDLTGDAFQHTGIELEAGRAVRLEDTVVDLHLVEDREVSAGDQDDSIRPGRLEARGDERDSVSAVHLLRRVTSGETAVVVGEPGAGKTTLLKQIAISSSRGRTGFHSIPLYVPLREWAGGSEWKEPDSIYRTFLRGRGVRGRSLASAARLLAGYCRRRDAGEPLLLLLDGWDETPARHRDRLWAALRPQIEGVCTVLTSRPSGMPRTLGAPIRYEVSALSAATAAHLVHKFFHAAGKPEKGERVLLRLLNWPAGSPFRRNPFLLTLYCRVALRTPEAALDASLPLSRARVYNLALLRLLDEHNRQWKSHPLNEEHLGPVERFARRLMFKQREPRYTFAVSDLAADDAFPRAARVAFSRSRLVTATTSAGAGRQFVHATIQEYMAARGFRAASPPSVAAAAERTALRGPWAEFWRFAVGLLDGERSSRFWAAVRRKLEQPDRFGLCFAAVAPLLREVGVQDGGKELTGLDVCAELWRYAVDLQYDGEQKLRVLADLFPSRLVDRLRAHLPDTGDGGNLSVEEHLGLILDHPERVQELSPDQILWLKGLGHPVSEVTRSVSALRASLVDRAEPAPERARSLSRLAEMRDTADIEPLSRLARDPGELLMVVPAIEALSHIGGPRAGEVLTDWLLDPDLRRRVTDCLSHAEEVYPSPADGEVSIKVLGLREEGSGGILARALREAAEPVARDRLLAELARRPATDPLIPDILAALQSVPFRRGALALLPFLRSSDAAVRRAALSAACYARNDVVSHAVASIARESAKPDEVAAALDCLGSFRWSGPVDWIARTVTDAVSAPSIEVRSTAARVLALLGESGTDEATRRAATDAYAGLLGWALTHPHDDVSELIVGQAEAAGVRAIPLMLKALGRNKPLPVRFRSHLCDALGELRATDALPALRQLCTGRGRAEVAHAAARAVAKMDPASLLDGRPVRHGPVDSALLDYATRTGAFVYADRIELPSGLVLGPDPGGRPDRRRLRPTAVSLNLKCEPNDLGDLIDPDRATSRRRAGAFLSPLFPLWKDDLENDPQFLWVQLLERSGSVGEVSVTVRREGGHVQTLPVPGGCMSADAQILFKVALAGAIHGQFTLGADEYMPTKRRGASPTATQQAMSRLRKLLVDETGVPDAERSIRFEEVNGRQRYVFHFQVTVIVHSPDRHPSHRR